MNTKAVIIFFKYPCKGQVKTRLAKDIGNEHAVGLYSAMIEDAVSTVSETSADLFLFSAGDPGNCESPVEFEKIGTVIPQEGKDLGQRMYNAFTTVHSRGYEKACIIGTDIPSITGNEIETALDSLSSEPAVLGPSSDGGYYLIGLTPASLKKELFYNMTWSVDTVFKETVKRMDHSGFSPFILEKRDDIDTINDLKRFYLDCKNSQKCNNTIKYIQKNEEEFHEYL